MEARKYNEAISEYLVDFKDQGWRSVYWRPCKRALPVIYVDDFILSAPRNFTAEIGYQLRSDINLEEPAGPDRLGL